MNIQDQIRKVIFESLIKESQAFKALEQQMSKVDETFIKYAQDRITELDKEMEDARKKRDFPRYKNALEEKVRAMDDLISAHKKRMEILEKMKKSISLDQQAADNQGERVFMEEKLESFANDEFQKGDRVRFESQSAFFEIEKGSEEQNQFVVQDTNVDGIKLGDVLVIQDFAIGGTARMRIYRKIGQRFEDLGETEVHNINSIVKDPA